MKSTEITNKRLPTPQELNVIDARRVIFNSFRVIEQALPHSVDYIYGYSYLILSEL